MKKRSIVVIVTTVTVTVIIIIITVIEKCAMTKPQNPS
jgi:hypothetical protein